MSGPAAMKKPLRLLLVNPNSNPAVTALAAAAAERVLHSGMAAKAVEPEGGPLSIETLDHRRVAEPLAIDLLAHHPGYDAYAMACFDDIALGAGRRFLDRPIVGSAEAALAIARCFAPRVAIVTTVETMVPGIRAQLSAMGADGWCTVRAAGIGVADAADGGGTVEARIDDAIVKARDIDGAGVIILGSGGLTGRAVGLARKHRLPVIDSIEAAVGMAELAARLVQGQRAADPALPGAASP